MSLEQINAILNTIPIDITFVDDADKVQCFSQGKEGYFIAQKQLLGGMYICVAPSSVNIVVQIIKSFKDGTKDYEDFCIQSYV